MGSKKNGIHKRSLDEEDLEFIKKNYGRILPSNIAKTLGHSVQTIYRAAEKLGLKKHYKRNEKRKQRSYLPEYPDDNKFYLNYEVSSFYYRQLFVLGKEKEDEI